MLIEDGLLISEDKEVRSLHHSCRIAIRGFLQQPIRDSIKQLPLPKKVRKTLVFHYLPVYDFNHDLTPFTLIKGLYLTTGRLNLAKPVILMEIETSLLIHALRTCFCFHFLLEYSLALVILMEIQTSLLIHACSTR